jgi:hypothetical protein
MSTAMDMNKREKELQARAFEARAEDFFKRWSPGNSREDAEFHRDLMMLVRTIYQDAQAPLLDHIMKMSATMVFSPMVIPDGQANTRG